MSPPNILFILIDDMGWRDLGCQGSPFYETPNIDQLAQDGMRFTRAYASCPVCSPTRASIMTGKYPARVGITQWIGGHFRGRVIGAPYLHYLPFEEKSLARAFHEHGYRTYHVGKWHLGDESHYPEHHGFEVNIAGCHMGSPWQGYFSPWGIPTLEDGPEGEYLTDRLTDEAIKLLEHNGDASFFMYLSYYSVHTPIQAPEENVSKFRTKAHTMGLDKVEAFRAGEREFFLEGQQPRTIPQRVVQSDPTYAGMIERLDWNIGRVMTTLRERGYEENTIIVFYSDNGGLSDSSRAPTSNVPLRHGKSYIYEGGIREPLIIKWPAVIPPGTTCETPITTPDFYPTFLECCQIPQNPDQHIDGKSFEPVLRDPKVQHDREPIFWHYPHYNGNGACPASCVIDRPWKLIEWLESGECELYNLEQDVGETTNLADQEPEIRDRFKQILTRWREEVNALVPETNPNFPGFLSETFMTISGEYSVQEDLGPCVKTSLSPRNPQMFDIPIAEIFEDFLEKTLHLHIGDTSRVGRMYTDADDRVWFADTHLEQNVPMEVLLNGFAGQEVSICGWDKIPEEYIGLSKQPDNEPHIEIVQRGWTGPPITG